MNHVGGVTPWRGIERSYSTTGKSTTSTYTAQGYNVIFPSGRRDPADHRDPIGTGTGTGTATAPSHRPYPGPGAGAGPGPGPTPRPRELGRTIRRISGDARRFAAFGRFPQRAAATQAYHCLAFPPVHRAMREELRWASGRMGDHATEVGAAELIQPNRTQAWSASRPHSKRPKQNQAAAHCGTMSAGSAPMAVASPSTHLVAAAAQKPSPTFAWPACAQSVHQVASHEPKMCAVQLNGQN